jgi:MYXO-CTERM domain-containing protein
MKSDFSSSGLPSIPKKMSILGASALVSLGISQGATTGITVGADNFGAWGIRNLSDTYLITSLSILLTNDTFFDSASTAPGTAATGWGTQASLGTVSATYPSNASTDGLQAASFTTVSFDPGDILNFYVDLDLYASPDGAGNVTGAIITALFRDNLNNFIGTETVTLALGSISLNGFGYSHSASTIPEPTAALLGGIGMLALLRRRRN